MNPLLCGEQEGCKVLREHKTTFPVPSNLITGDYTKGIQWPQQGVFEGAWPFFQDSVFNTVGCIRVHQAG